MLLLPSLSLCCLLCNGLLAVDVAVVVIADGAVNGSCGAEAAATGAAATGALLQIVFMYCSCCYNVLFLLLFLLLLFN